MSDAVEVCPICDIAGCYHIRERKSRADLPPPPEQIAAGPRVQRLVHTLKEIAKWRNDCHEYDRENGHDLREFGEEDLALIEVWANRALEEFSTPTTTKETK